MGLPQFSVQRRMPPKPERSAATEGTRERARFTISGSSVTGNRPLALAVPLDRERLRQFGGVARRRRLRDSGVVVGAVLQPPDVPGLTVPAETQGGSLSS